MSVSAKFLTFSKRQNSTKQPNLTGATNYDIVFKQPCSMENPTITLQTSNPTAFNYCYIDIFSRYYFVQDWTSVHNGIWEAILKVDTMASFKSQITAGTHYILRSASDSDGDIIDTLYPTKTDVTIQQGSSVSIFNPADITFVIGILNNERSNKAGAVQYLAMNSTEMADLMEFLLGVDAPTQTDSFLQTISTLNQAVQDGVARSLINPTQYIVESYALPYAPDVGSAVTIKCGWWYLANTASVIRPRTNHINIASGSLSLPAHPQAASRGHYLSAAPYTRYTLNLGPFGVYPLDATKAINSPSVGYNVYGDNFGNITCELSLGGEVIDKLTACVKNPFAIGQVNMDALGAMGSGIALASGIGGAVDNPEQSTMGAIGSNILSSINTLLPQVTRQGNQGNFANVFPNFESIAEHYTVVDEMNAERGRPLCKSKTLSSLSGYCLCSEAEVQITGTNTEAQEINNYLNNGFFIE